jgi:urease accessory protein
MPWLASLELDYTLSPEGRTTPRYQHSGPLRVLHSLYPEGNAVCHNVLVHPPSGLVGGDTLDIRVSVGAGAHGLITTPGATRFYRSQGDAAYQRTQVRLESGARLEWLPLETLAYSGCLAENRLMLDLAPGAELLAWDVTALGLPLAGQPFEAGYLTQHTELVGQWLERGVLDACDAALMHGPVGLAGHRCLASVMLVAGKPWEPARAEQALLAARDVIALHPLMATAGATQPHPQVLLVRMVAPLVEPAMDLAQRVRAVWRQALWSLAPATPRTWAL